MVLHAVTTCSDWQLPLALAPLREQLEVLGAVAPVPVILEVGSTVSLRTVVNYRETVGNLRNLYEPADMGYTTRICFDLFDLFGYRAALGFLYFPSL